MYVAFGEWLNTAPLLVIFLALCAGLVVFALLGRRLRRRFSIVDSDSQQKFDQEGFVVSSVMGLLALLIGFTFALAIDRFDTRRTRVLEEANAIGTTYLRAQLLEEPHRARISKMLVEYTDNRVVLAQEAQGPKQRELLAKSDQLITDMWTATVAAFPSMKPYPYSSSFLETMNGMIDMDAARKTARQAHVPSVVFLMLFVYQLIAAGVLGYVFSGRPGRQTAAFLLLLFALSIMLVLDIDRPTAGAVREPQGPMLELQASLHASPPHVFDRLNGTPAAPAR